MTTDINHATLESDSEDGSVGLPGDADYDFSSAAIRRWEPPVSQVMKETANDVDNDTAMQTQQDASPMNSTMGQQALGFEILGFQGSNTERKAPPKGLTDRLANGARKQKKREKADKPPKRPKQKKAKKEAPPPPPESDEDDVDKDERDDTTAMSESGAMGPIGVNVGIENEAVPASPSRPLSDEDRSALSGLIHYFGEDVAQNVKGHRWSHRLDAINAISDSLHDIGVRCGKRESTDAGAEWQKAEVLEVLAENVLSSGLEDSVFQVFAATTALLSQILSSFVHDLHGDMVKDYIVAYDMIGVLVGKLAACNSRVREVAKDALVAISHHRFLGVHLVAQYCLMRYDSHTSISSYKLLIGKVNLLISLLQEHQLVDEDDTTQRGTALSPASSARDDEDPVYTMENVMQLAAFALSIVNQKIRRTAITLVVDLYKRHGRKCEQYLRHLPAAIIKTLKQEIEIELCDVEAFGSTDLIEQEEEDIANLEKGLCLTEAQELQLAKWERTLRVKSVSCIRSKKWCLRERVYTRIRSLLLGEVDMTLVDVTNIMGYDPEVPSSTKQSLNGTIGRGKKPAFGMSATGALSTVSSPAKASSAGGSMGSAPTHRVFIHPDNTEATRAAFAVCVEILEACIQDTVPQLVISCMQCASAIIQCYLPQDAITAELLKQSIGALILPRLIVHVSSATQSVATAAMDLLTQMARAAKIGVSFISTSVMQQGVVLNKSGTESWKITLARLRILLHLTTLFEFEGNGKGLSTEEVMQYTVGSFQCTNGKVRGAAVEVIIEVYKKCGNVIRVYLRNQKQALLTDLKDRIARVARKDRTKSAPIQTLSSMIQPLDVEDGLESVMPSRPATFPAALEIEDPTMQQPKDSMKAKIQRWKHEQQLQQREADVQEKNTIPSGIAAQAKRADGMSSEGQEGATITRVPSEGSVTADGEARSLRKSSGNDLGGRKNSMNSSLRSSGSKGTPGSCVLPPRHGNHLNTRLVLG